MTHRVEYRSPQPGDGKWIAENLRESDMAEVRAFGLWPDPEGLIAELAEADGATIATYLGEPIAALGLGPTEDEGVMIPWMFATEKADHYPKMLHRECVQILSQWKTVATSLYNFVSADNEKTIRWLEALGFRVECVLYQFSEHGGKFRRFVWEE